MAQISSTTLSIYRILSANTQGVDCYTVIMRKYVLGFIIAAIFVAYSIVLRSQHSEPVVAPSSLAKNNAATNPSSTSSPSSTPAATPSTTYKDGTYTGSVANAFYGNLQVSATISGGKITAVDFLEYPDDNPNSINVNQTAMPYLKQEAIQAQSAKVSVVSGATLTSHAFIQSLSSALSQAM